MTAKVTATIRTYDESSEPEIQVHSHWNETGAGGKIVLQIGNEKFSVAAQDLKQAISSCSGLS